MPEPIRRVDLGALTSEVGYFLPLSTSSPPPSPFHHDPDEGPWRFDATFRDSPPALRDDVLELIRGARHKVLITSFILGDDALTETLLAAADRLTGGVYVISELSEASLRRGLARLEEASEKGQEIGAKVEIEKKRFMGLTRRGVALRGHEDCHAKFVVVDDAIAWVGSANLETRAFTEVGEVGVVTTEPAEVDRLARLFARMWLAGARWELPSAADYSVRERPTAERSPVSFAVPPAPPGPGPAIVWTDEKDHGILTAIHETIGAARHTLLLASFSLDSMVDRPDLLLEPVAAAVERGVKVSMLVRAHHGRERHRRDAAALHDLGVRMLADRLNHAKAAVADGTSGVLFSANFEVRHGLDAGSGLEIGARLDGTPALAGLTAYLRHAMDAADHHFVPHPSQRLLVTHEILGGRRRWPWPDEIHVRAGPSAWQDFAAESQNAPALWTREKGGPMLLHLGTGSWTLDRVEDTVFRLGARSQSSETAAARLERLRRRFSTPVSYGFCPAVLVHSDE